MTPALAALLLAGKSPNLLFWTDDFTNPVWQQVSAQTIVANNVAGPDGAMNADTFTSNSADPLLFEQINAGGGQIYTGSWYLKVPSGTLATKLQLANQAGTTLGVAASINLTTAWQRFTVTQTLGAADSGIRLMLGGFASLPSTTVVHLGGAMLNLGAAALDYRPRGGA